jgi:amino acid transporter
MATQDTEVGSPATHGLRRSVLGLLAVGGLGAIIMGPAGSLYFNADAIQLKAGPIMPFVFFIALIVSIPTAISYAMVSKELPTAGQAYTWLWRSMRPEVGLWMGVVLVLYYMCGLWLVACSASIFFADFLGFFGIHTSFLINFLGVLVLFAATGFVVYNNIHITARVALGFLFFESAAAAALGVTVLAVKGSEGHLTFLPFTTVHLTGGFTALSGAVIFGILSFIGYDYCAVVAEEAKTPRRLIPMAVVLSCVIVGIYWIIFSWGYSIAVPTSEMAKFATQGFEAATPIARIYWGSGAAIIIPITGITLSVGVYIATVPVLARVLFAMGRDGTLPQWFGQIRPRRQVPANAATAVLLVAFAGAVAMAGLQHTFFSAFIWYGEISVFFALIAYIMVNLASFLFYRRFRREKFNVVWNLLIPLIGIAIDVYVLWQSFFVALWGTGWALGTSVIAFGFAILVLGVAYVFFVRHRKPEVLRHESYVLPDVAS